MDVPPPLAIVSFMPCSRLPTMLEICVDCVESARAAGLGGADRVELCAALPEGGTTPSLGMIERVRETFTGCLMVIIRPRGHDFLFDTDEMAVMALGILTSGAAASAELATDMIRRMVLRAGSDAVIMPGGGLGSGNLAAILQATGASEAHLSARHDIASGMAHRNPHVFMGNFTRGTEYQRRVTCADAVRRCGEILRDHRMR